METEILTREQVQSVVTYVEGELRDKNPGLTFYISGPWRAGAEQIDKLIILVKTTDYELMDSQGHPKIVLPSALEHFEDAGLGVWGAHLRTPHGFLLTELYLVNPQWMGAHLWWSTGPEDLWLAMQHAADLADRKLVLSGLYQNDQKIDDGTEYDIARKLYGTDFLAVVEPSKRANWAAALREQWRLFGTVATVEEIKSERDAKVWYEVWIDRTGRAVRCECRGFTYRSTCKHLEQAEARHTERGARPVEDRV